MKYSVFCKKCGKGNPMVAKFCSGCGAEMDEDFAKQMYKKSKYRKLEIVDKVISVFSLSFITENIWFRVIFLTVLILVGVIFNLVGLNQFCIKPGDGYEVTYDTENKRYIVSCDAVNDMNLKLKVPHDTQSLTITTYDKKGNEVGRDDVEIAKNINFSDITNSYYELRTEERSIQVEFSYKGDSDEQE